MRGYRYRMEDGSAILKPLSKVSRHAYRFCGVFDGHAQSRRVANWLEDLLPNNIGSMRKAHWMTREGIERACIDADKTILSSDISDAGSTAIFCVLKQKKDCDKSTYLTIGSVGDSQALISHSDFSKPPSVPLGHEIHRPHTMASESERVRRAGGFILNSRVDGELAVTRAFGDSKFKRDISRSLREQKVVAVPSVAENLSISVGDTLILACDGVFDVMTPGQVDSFFKSCFVSTLVRYKQVPSRSSKIFSIAEVLSEVAGRLLDEAIIRGSTDNLTVMLLRRLERNPIVSSDYLSIRYIPPILFLDPSDSFLSMVRDELRSLSLEEDFLLPRCQLISSHSRSVIADSFISALASQWDSRSSWIHLVETELKDVDFGATDRNIFIHKLFSKFKLLCSSNKATNSTGNQQKRHNRAGSSEHVSSLGPSMTLSELQSRQTSADEFTPP